MRNSRFLGLIASFLLLGVLSGCASKNAIEPVDLPKIEASAEVDVLWDESAGDDFSAYYQKVYPAVSSQLVYSVGSKGRLRAYQKSDGDSVWSQKLGGPISGGAEVGYGDVAVVTTQGELTLFDAETGAIRWQKTLALRVLAPPLLTDQAVIVQSSNDVVMAFNRQTGETRWRYSETLPLVSLWGNNQPQFYNGWVLCALGNGKLIALDQRTGQLEWERTIGVAKGQGDIEQIVDLDGKFTIADDVLYVGSYQDNVVAMDLISGGLLWYQSLSTYNDLSVDESSLYVVDNESVIHSLGRYDGGEIWQSDALYGRQLSGVGVFEDYLAVMDFEGYLHVLDKYTGQLVGRKRLDNEAPAGGFVIEDNIGYIITRNADLNVFTLNPITP